MLCEINTVYKRDSKMVQIPLKRRIVSANGGVSIPI